MTSNEFDLTDMILIWYVAHCAHILHDNANIHMSFAKKSFVEFSWYSNFRYFK